MRSAPALPKTQRMIFCFRGMRTQPDMQDAPENEKSFYRERSTLLGMESAIRKLTFQKSPYFTGFTCSACDWTQPIPRTVDSEEDLPKSIETDFANHNCARYLRKPPATSAHP